MPDCLDAAHADSMQRAEHCERSVQGPVIVTRTGSDIGCYCQAILNYGTAVLNGMTAYQ